MVMPPLIRGLIATYQWRTTFVILGAAVLVILIPGAQFLKATPEALGLRPYGLVKDEADNPGATYLGADLQSVSLRHALKTGAFWILCALYATFLFSQQVTMVHIPSHARTLGFSPAVGAMVLSVIGGASLAGRILGGGLGDRIGHAAALAVDLGLVLLAFLWLPLTTKPWMIFVFAGMFGVGYGGVVVLVSPMLAELFGLRSLGAIFGSVTFLATVGGSVGPIVAGHIFDVAGSYRTALWVCTGLVGMSLGGAALLLRRWRRPGQA